MLKVKIFASAGISVFGFGIFLFMILGFLQPFSCCYRTVRYSTLKVIFNVVISPCGQVTFLHYLATDILSSLSKPLKDVRYCFCYYVNSTAWLHDTPNACEDSTQ